MCWYGMCCLYVALSVVFFNRRMVSAKPGASFACAFLRYEEEDQAMEAVYALQGVCDHDIGPGLLKAFNPHQISLMTFCKLPRRGLCLYISLNVCECMCASL